MMVIDVVVLDDVDGSEDLTMTKEVHKLSFRIKRSVSKVTKQITSTPPGSVRIRIRIRIRRTVGVFTPVGLNEGMKNRCGSFGNGEGHGD